MKRREFVAGASALVGAGLLAGSASGASSGSAGVAIPAVEAESSRVTENISAGRIDVHHHIFSPALRECLQRHHVHQLAGNAIPDWTPESSLGAMERSGVRTAITSVVMPGLSLEKSELVHVSRSSNEYSADLVRRYPGRFGFFAHVPLPFTDNACAEAIHALDTLNADGVVLLASNGEKFLGDESFDELMGELDRRQATVFVHPNLHPSTVELGLDMPPGLLEFSCDLTRAGLNLILSGTMERYPHIRWILAHAGGFLPYVAWRVSLANAMPEFSDKAALGVLNYLRRFYFDTASSASRYSMATLRELVEPSRILFGSDAPYETEGQTLAQITALGKDGFWSAQMVGGVEREHALSLFPRFRLEGEVVAAAPLYDHEPWSGQMKRQMLQPLRSLAQNMRK
ncbi:amidohydrolase [Pseudomonas taiwanensis]|uniref:amidohydrolase family protein n=1 Tax=Pseudomonas taiwanensis TaxID=470150 RepID=UPI0015C12FD5|nr:amidohydrolase family protein [Pseudomonas taiwanensis]NWL76595.1 amidohydrolase [Pseudomonas taiwanensis]